MTSIDFDAGYGLRDTVGAWLRVRSPADTPLATMLAAFELEGQGSK